MLQKMLFLNTLEVSAQLLSCQRLLKLHVCHGYFHPLSCCTIENFAYKWCPDSLGHVMSTHDTFLAKDGGHY